MRAGTVSRRMISVIHECLENVVGLWLKDGATSAPVADRETVRLLLGIPLCPLIVALLILKFEDVVNSGKVECMNLVFLHLQPLELVTKTYPD